MKLFSYSKRLSTWSIKVFLPLYQEIISTRPNKKNDLKGQKRIAKMIMQPQIVPLNLVTQNLEDKIEKEPKNVRIRLKRERDW
jgi:hypothetical protein